jgi:hypothetical protein
MWVGERDDLTGVAGIGDDLLVAGQGGVEDNLAGGEVARWLGADQLALEHAPVGQYQQPVTNRHRAHPCIVMLGAA